ncbi:MAG: hypothetical protein IMY72_12530 [Bacteroidetes bacterium]|nr:hypothetical protein [Bacteroidota bacterium]
MRFNIVTEYSAWFVIICLIIAFVYSFLLYKKDKSFIDTPLKKLKLLSLFRFLSVFIISFFLLSPFIKSIKKNIEKPIIIFAQDNSESIILNKDSLFYQNQYKINVNKFLQNISKNYDVKTYSFGEGIENGLSFDFLQKETDFSNLIKEINNNYSNRNVGALIVASDGVYNKGDNPNFVANNIKFPIYTIALGDTNTQKDIILSQVDYNRIVFLGDKFPIQLTINANQQKKSVTYLNIYNNNKQVYSQKILINNNNFSSTLNILLKAKNSGLQKYKIELLSESKEISKINNSKIIAVDVIKNKQNILILSYSPHPDIGALREVLERNENFKLEYYTVDKFNKQINDYNLVILDQIPNNNYSASNLLSKIFINKIPVLFIIGTQSNLVAINNLQAGINIKQNRKSFEETQASFNKKFILFDLSKEAQTFISELPPLISPFGTYSADDASSVLFSQSIKDISTNKPLIYFNNNFNHKIGFIMGEGLWRWRLYDFNKHYNINIFTEIVNKTVQYLSLKVNKSQFIIKTDKIFSENQTVIFESQLYNKSFQLINSPDVFLDVFDKEGKKFQFVFNRTDKSYIIDAGAFQVGDYNYDAHCTLGSKRYSRKGSFAVLPLKIENENTVADFNLLYKLSNKTKGEMFYPNQFEQLFSSLKNKSSIHSVVYYTKNLFDVINLKWIFFLILTLLSGEWFLRKFFGNY